jgi:hypothetical protein
MSPFDGGGRHRRSAGGWSRTFQARLTVLGLGDPFTPVRQLAVAEIVVGNPPLLELLELATRPHEAVDIPVPLLQRTQFGVLPGPSEDLHRIAKT